MRQWNGLVCFKINTSGLCYSNTTLAMIDPEHCAREEELVPAVKAGGIREVRISLDGKDGTFVVSVEIRSTGEVLYLATRRNPNEPRKFKRVDVAMATATKMFGATKFIVVTR